MSAIKLTVTKESTPLSFEGKEELKAKFTKVELEEGAEPKGEIKLVVNYKKPVEGKEEREDAELILATFTAEDKAAKEIEQVYCPKAEAHFKVEGDLPVVLHGEYVACTECQKKECEKAEEKPKEEEKPEEKKEEEKKEEEKKEEAKPEEKKE